MKRLTFILSIAPIAAIFVSPIAPAALAQSATVVKAGVIHVGDGKVIRDGAILIQNGKITAVGRSIPIPRGAVVHDAKHATVTPGFIDADCGIGLTLANEESREVSPDFRVVDALDPRHAGFKQRLRHGVTAAFVAPGSRAVIGGQGVVIKTTGGSLADVLVSADAGMRAVTGPEASAGNRATSGSSTTSMYHRRPATRMGIIFMMRDTFYQMKNGTADAVVTAALRPVVKGASPLRVHARNAVDIRTALRLKREFGDMKLRIVLDEATEAYRVTDEIKANGASVVLGPFYFYPRSRYEQTEGYDLALDNAAICHRAGIPIAFRTGGRDPGQWRGEIGLLVAYGLPHAAAIQALTLDAARVLGVEGRIGSIESGKDADLVLWDGDPLSPRTKVLAVMVAGKVHHADAGTERP